MDFFSDEARRNPYPLYAQARRHSPVVEDPQSGVWMVFDYAGVDRVLTDAAAFSSRYGPDWLSFTDPPRHGKLRALVSQAFTPRSVAALEPRIAALCRELLARVADRDEFDFAEALAVPLPVMVIAEMLGIPPGDRVRFVAWNDVLLEMSRTIPTSKSEGSRRAMDAFVVATAEMDTYLAGVLDARRAEPRDDLLTRLLNAEVDGERLTRPEILGFFQLLLLAGSETTTNLLNNAVLLFTEHPAEFTRLRENPDLLPGAIEEVLRYRSPLQWMYRRTARDVELHGRTIPASRTVLAMMGSANHDDAVFPEPERFDLARTPNPHVAFGHGSHFCLGAPLARLECRVALTEVLTHFTAVELATTEPLKPRAGLHVLGPANLPVSWTRA